MWEKRNNGIKLIIRKAPECLGRKGKLQIVGNIENEHKEKKVSHKNKKFSGN